MVHGILQFTPSIAFRYVLHRCESRDIRCRESFVFKEQRASPRTIRERGARGGLPILVFLGAFRAGVRWPPKRARKRASRRGREGASAPKCLKRVRGSFCFAGFDNDPSAGSPTETLLRLLLPLNDKVQWTSRDVAGSEPPTSPRSEHFTGSFNR
ncbi:hypothetical protein KY285_011041 [Solanum tuberosum]|nr:hypothetical protein KY284_025234 [Solanum tuberosum]KAH0677414.1 hypothetical protein KY285_025215 [Solanum tuberosum]KAH0735334.1 hypothetical protein KY285_011041 [Solanum tuberosum]